MACVASLGPAMLSVDTMMCPHQCGIAPVKLLRASFLMHLSETPDEFPHELHTPRPRKL